MADEQQPPEAEGDRPSFSQFWKRSKDDKKNLTFVHSSAPEAAGKGGKASGGVSGSGVGSTSPNIAAKEKAQLRRAQVRKAQIQHRQRKANYIKQLELDIIQVREMIAESERESKQLRNENAAIRQKLTVVTNQPTTNKTTTVTAAFAKQPSISPTGTGFLSAGSPGVSDVFSSPGPQMPPSATTTSFFSDPGLDDVTMSLQIDETMNYPCFQFKRNSSQSSGGWESTSAAGASPPQPSLPGSPPQHLSSVPGVDLTPQQTDTAINFILALEHVCWGHFHASHFAPDASPSGKESAHTLMASTIALTTAPPQIFKLLGKTQRNVWFTPSALSSNPISGDITWNTSGLTLQTLHGLATSLNPGDKELTPVQAWFELARSFGVEVLLDGAVVEGLKREFHGVVKCVHYGATIEREAFESVVGRVIGGAFGVEVGEDLAGMGSPGLAGGVGGSAMTGPSAGGGGQV